MRVSPAGRKSREKAPRTSPGVIRLRPNDTSEQQRKRRRLAASSGPERRQCRERCATWRAQRSRIAPPTLPNRPSRTYRSAARLQAIGAAVESRGRQSIHPHGGPPLLPRRWRPLLRLRRLSLIHISALKCDNQMVRRARGEPGFSAVRAEDTEWVKHSE